MRGDNEGEGMNDDSSLFVLVRIFVSLRKLHYLRERLWCSTRLDKRIVLPSMPYLLHPHLRVQTPADFPPPQRTPL